MTVLENLPEKAKGAMDGLKFGLVMAVWCGMAAPARSADEGQVTAQVPRALLEQYDVNRNGVLEPEELAAMHEEEAGDVVVVAAGGVRPLRPWLHREGLPGRPWKGKAKEQAKRGGRVVRAPASNGRR